MSEQTPGYRNDAGKPLYHLLPADALEGVVKVLTFGASKYAERNWEKGMSWSRCFNSMMRHAWAWWRGEDLDPESGLPHVDHMACNALFLATYWRRPRLQQYDDREHRAQERLFARVGIVDPFKDCVSCGGTKGYHRVQCDVFAVEFRGGQVMSLDTVKPAHCSGSDCEGDRGCMCACQFCLPRKLRNQEILMTVRLQPVILVDASSIAIVVVDHKDARGVVEQLVAQANGWASGHA